MVTPAASSRAGLGRLTLATIATPPPTLAKKHSPSTSPFPCAQKPARDDIEGWFSPTTSIDWRPILLLFFMVPNRLATLQRHTLYFIRESRQLWILTSLLHHREAGRYVVQNTGNSDVEAFSILISSGAIRTFFHSCGIGRGRVA